MEKVKAERNSNIDSFKNNEKVAEKIDSLWGVKKTHYRNNKFESRKIILKFETNGIKKRKFALKMKNESQNSHFNNFSLISELIKEFFNSSSNLE